MKVRVRIEVDFGNGSGKTKADSSMTYDPKESDETRIDYDLPGILGHLLADCLGVFAATDGYTHDMLLEHLINKLPGDSLGPFKAVAEAAAQWGGGKPFSEMCKVLVLKKAMKDEAKLSHAIVVDKFPPPLKD